MQVMSSELPIQSLFASFPLSARCSLKSVESAQPWAAASLPASAAKRRGHVTVWIGSHLAISDILPT